MKTATDIELLLQTINEALFTVDADCNIQTFNRAAEELTGYTESEVLDCQCSDIFRSDICHTNCAVKESLRTDKRVRRRLVTMKHRDGTPVRISVSTSPLHDKAGHVTGAVETIRPLSEEERLQEALAGESRKTKAILSSLEECVVTVDHNWKITSINAAAERTLGIRSKDAVGFLCSQVLRANKCQNGCPLVKTLRGQEPLRDEMMTLTSSSGEPIEVSMNTAVLQGIDGEAMGGVLSFREINEVEKLKAELAGEHHFKGIVGRSPAMRALFRLIEEVAPSHSTVLITGESGTGKEMVAEAIQELSARSQRPFVKVNCSVLSDGVLESELFGHVKGAFTDAIQNRKGRFELAHGGTLFLDEIGDVSPAMQVKLLRVLQERKFERVGGEESIQTDVRFLAATNQDLEERVANGSFREDLYYRLNVIPVRIPPLRERKEDIPLLVHHFLKKYSLLTGKHITGIQDKAMETLESCNWPGNVRQLENCIEFAFARAKGSLLTLHLLPPEIRGNKRNGRHLDEEETEASRIRRALERNHWHHGRTAEDLGISRTTLWRKMKQHHL